MNLGRSGKLCLIQIASPHAVYLFDILAGKEDMFDKGKRDGSMLLSSCCVQLYSLSISVLFV